MSWFTRRDDGRISVFFAVTFSAVIIMIGLTVDGAGRIQAMQRADHFAAEAARAGGQAIKPGAAIEGGPKRIHEGDARFAVDAYLDAVRASGYEIERHETGFGEYDLLGAREITVVVVIRYKLKMLSFLVGADKLVEGRATARLLTDSERT